MNNDIATHTFRFLFLVLIQILILNHINFLGYLNPYLYIIFILLAPITINRSLFLVVCFLLGLFIDMAGDSGGIHAAACVTIAYLRPFILRSSFGLSYEFQTIKLNKVRFGERLAYVTLMVLIHHLILFFLETFNFSHIVTVLKKTLFSSLFTILTTMLALVLFRKNNS
ncbi:rod shape-determining protein MreD [Aquimarina hainanensis]|uniref:Rod shape-determining protein MreD n=1 Tax=Aquimarina hainanensis TaxID=1578017 RepID=A0ABW5N4U0_9FLAO|nr:rod shape-determining protein MreD [Aquimarina sp. TRL1]QKX05076.1 rod shape-determining protein MreD [Aquimarina sp. TRL1]